MAKRIAICFICLLAFVGCAAQPGVEPPADLPTQAEESAAESKDEPAEDPGSEGGMSPDERFNRDFRQLIAENGIGNYAGLTTEQMLEDLDQLYGALVENYPYFGVVKRMLGVDIHERYRHYREQIPQMRGDTDFFLLVLDFLQETENLGHLAFSGSGCTDELAELVRPFHLQAMQAYTEAVGAVGDGNVTTEIVEEGKTAYVKIDSFSPSFYEQDRETLLSFYSRVSDYDNLIIDITANSGGGMGYYIDLIVEPNITESLYTTHFSFYKGGRLNLAYLEERGYPFELLFPIDEAPEQHIDTLRGAAAAMLGEEVAEEALELLVGQAFPPPKLNDDDYREFDFYDISLMSFDPMGPEKLFGGDIWVLISDTVYSASESFAIFCKETGFATLVGEQTGGEGIGSDPVQIRLEHSGIGVRYAPVYGTLLDGTGSQENGTKPDIQSPAGQSALDTCLGAIEAKNEQ